MKASLATVLLAVCAVAGPARAADTDDAVSRRLFADLLAPVQGAAESAGATGIAVRGMPSAAGAEKNFFEAVGDEFLDAGYEVWLVRPDEVVPTGVLALDLELSASEIDYPRQARALLGFGRARVLRRVSLGAHLRLTNPGSGQVLLDSSPVRVAEEWLSFSEANASAAVRPDWMGAIPVAEMEQRNPWWQRGLVVGIVAGVGVLYFSGAN